MTGILLALSALCLVLAALYHYAAAEVFDLLVPKDGGTTRLARNLPYGEHRRQRLDIYRPATGAGPWPIMVFVHGGSWQTGSKNAYSFAGRALAARGFLTLVIDYRLHPAHRYPAFVQDVAQAIGWAFREAWRFGGKPANLFVMGHSAGAYNAVQAVLDKTRLAEAGLEDVAINGLIGLAGPYDFLPLDVKVTLDVFGEVPNLPATQPVNHASADAPPTLLMHGERDSLALPRNSRTLHAVLTAAGATSELVVYPKLGHVGILLAMAKPFRLRAPVLDDISAFVRNRMR